MTNDFEVRAEMILPKFDIARTTRRQKIAGKYSARFPDALERQIASNVPFSLQNAASEKKTNGPQVKRVSMLDCGRLSPCISKLVATTATVPKQRKNKFISHQSLAFIHSVCVLTLWCVLLHVIVTPSHLTFIPCRFV